MNHLEFISQQFSSSRYNFEQNLNFKIQISADKCLEYHSQFQIRKKSTSVLRLKEKNSKICKYIKFKQPLSFPQFQCNVRGRLFSKHSYRVVSKKKGWPRSFLESIGELAFQRPFEGCCSLETSVEILQVSFTRDGLFSEKT